MYQKENGNVLELFETKPILKICAPMVRYSKLQFRNLVKKYDCDLVYTPMILADSFCKSEKARRSEFTTNSVDTPLIVQFAANTVHDFVGASHMVAPYCDGVDLNCGCPQRWAKEQGLGCEMLKNPQQIHELIRQCRNTIDKPFTVSVKMRIVKNNRDTIDICRNLEQCGVSFLSVHARTKEQITGNINEEALRLICENTNIPIVGNGAVNSLEECGLMQEKTKVNGVMVANGMLTNPTLFSGTTHTTMDAVQNWVDICYNSTLTLKQFDALNENNVLNGFITEKPKNLTFQCFHHHLVFMFEKLLSRSEKRIFNNLRKFGDVQNFMHEHFNIKPKLYSEEEFKRNIPINVNYEGRTDVYENLKPAIETSDTVDILFDSNDTVDIFDSYDSATNDGKYFKDKVEDNSSWTDIFLENG